MDEIIPPAASLIGDVVMTVKWLPFNYSGYAYGECPWC